MFTRSPESSQFWFIRAASFKILSPDSLDVKYDWKTKVFENCFRETRFLLSWFHRSLIELFSTRSKTHKFRKSFLTQCCGLNEWKADLADVIILFWLTLILPRTNPCVLNLVRTMYIWFWYTKFRRNSTNLKF